MNKNPENKRKIFNNVQNVQMEKNVLIFYFC